MKSAAEPALISLLAKHNWVANRVLTRWAYVPYGLASSVAAVALSRRGGATLAELGLERERIGDGVRVGAITSTSAAAAIATGAAIPATRRFYADDRVVHPHGATLVYEVGVRIPVGTAVVEEVLFRSALLGLSLHQRSWVSSAAWSSALFGVARAAGDGDHFRQRCPDRNERSRRSGGSRRGRRSRDDGRRHRLRRTASTVRQRRRADPATRNGQCCCLCRSSLVTYARVISCRRRPRGRTRTPRRLPERGHAGPAWRTAG